MPLRDLLSAERISIVPGAIDRDGVLDAAADLLARPPIADGVTREAIGAALRSRERLASTGLGHGVAIPHARIDGLEESRGAFLRFAEPVAFGAADGVPVDLVLSLAVPAHYVQQHLHQLAELAEHFADPAFRERLRDAGDADALAAALLHRPAPAAPTSGP